jgi:uncharacterized membrane protein
MILMPLDHTREFFTNYGSNPLDPQHTTVMLYLARWITHLCAPIFVFLAGTSIFLQHRHKTTGQLIRLLLTRGLWLSIADLTLVHLVFAFHWQWNIQILEVIWVVGISMMLMSALIPLGVRWNLIIGISIVALHNASDGLQQGYFGSMSSIWRLLHVPGFLVGMSGHPPIILVAYPLIPWVGVMALGYAFGVVLLKDRDTRITFCLRLGAGMICIFFPLRWSNLYGDPRPWTGETVWGRTMLSFFNVQKYPPSLLFLLVTLGCAALLFAGIEEAEKRGIFREIRNVLQVFGKVPFFYFLIHIALIHLFALTLSLVRGQNWRWWVSEFPHGGVVTGHPFGYGYGLPIIFAIWILVIGICYPVCRWYGRIRRRHWILSYL